MTGKSKDPSTPEVFGDNLSALRRKAGLTQPELSARSGISISSLYRAEKGDPSVSARTMGRLAIALGVEIGEIYSGETVSIPSRLVSADRAEEQHGEVVEKLERAARHDVEVDERLERIQSTLDSD